ncbi:MAG: PhoH family protein [Alphaproteobacteria bacterium]|nr:PhoH family protein [Alphaproteobacteria bacterium]
MGPRGKHVLKTKSTTLTLAIDDNRLTQRVAGPEDEHFSIIERALDVTISHADSGLAIRGAKAATETARDILSQLLTKAKADRKTHLDAGFVRGLLAHASGGPIEKIVTRKRTIEARRPLQNTMIRAMREHDLVLASGPAGTGKTYLAVCYAAAMLERGEVERIILCRPAVEAGERLGFLPGDMKEKVDPYLRPLYDALHDVLAFETVEKHIASKVIEIAPLAFMRGRTLAHAAVILDEAQNTTREQMKMFLTRIGEGSKMFVTGDVTQIDLPKPEQSGFIEALNILRGVESTAIVQFGNEDVVRRKLVGDIVRAYDKRTQTLKSGD